MLVVVPARTDIDSREIPAGSGHANNESNWRT